MLSIRALVGVNMGRGNEMQEGIVKDLALIQINILNPQLKIFSYLSILTSVVGAQKNRLIETVLLSTNDICFC